MIAPVDGASKANAIVVLDDDGNRTACMQEQLTRRLPEQRHIFFDNAPDMIAWLGDHLDEAALISLDHDLGPNRQRDGATFDPGTGRDVADYLASRDPQCSIIIATTNSLARPGMQLALDDAGWSHTSVLSAGDLEWIERQWIAAVVQALAAPE